MPDDNKEYLLNVIQAWVNLKIRVASFVLIANGAVLGTAFAFIKDKATELDEGFFPIRLAALGILFGGVALWIAYSYSNTYLTVQFEGHPKPAKDVKPKKPLSQQALEAEEKSKTLAYANWWFKFFVYCSVSCLILTFGYLSGVIAGRLDCIATHPASCFSAQPSTEQPANKR